MFRLGLVALVVCCLLVTAPGCGESPKDFSAALDDSAKAAAKGKEQVKAEAPTKSKVRGKGELADQDTF